MHGNVAEWVLDEFVADFYGKFKAGVADNPLAMPTKIFPHVVRGGSWERIRTKCRSAARARSDPAWQAQDPQIPKSIWYHTDAKHVGFRIIRPLVEPTDEEKAAKWDKAEPEAGPPSRPVTVGADVLCLTWRSTPHGLWQHPLQRSDSCHTPTNHQAQPSRRDFIRASSLLVAGGTGHRPLATRHTRHGLRVGLIGCGSRGSSAAIQVLNTTSGPVQLVAMADVFGDRLQGAYRQIRSQHADKLDLPPERRLVGLDAYRRLLAMDVDLVILATPPGFRPQHFEAAVAAGKHVFLEKPVAVDVPGVRRVLRASRKPKGRTWQWPWGCSDVTNWPIARRWRNCTAVASATGSRCACTGTVAVSKRVRGTHTRVNWNTSCDWYYFTWLSGDHIVEQHVQNLDVANWLLQQSPTEGTRRAAVKCANAAAMTARTTARSSITSFANIPIPVAARIQPEPPHQELLEPSFRTR